MRELADNVRAQFGDDNQRVFAVAINTDGNIDEQYLDDWEDISNGNLYELESSTDVGVTFNRILTGLGSDVLGDLDDTVTVLDDITFSARTTGQPLLSPSQAAKDVVMPPYQQLASFSLFKTNSDSQLILTNPSGDMLTDDDAFVTGEATPIEVWRVPNPEPGVWTLTTRRRVDGEEVADSGATISTELLRSSFSLERPEETPQMYLPVTSTVAFRDVAGDLLDAYPSNAYSLEGDLVITPPSGGADERRVSLAPDDDRPDKAVFVADFTPTQAGTYTLEVQASAEGEDGNTLQFSQELDLAVRDTLFEIEMNNDELLEQEDSVDVLEGVSRTYSLRFVDSSLNEISGIQVDQFEVATADDAESCADAQPLEDEAEDDPFFVRTAHTEPGDLALCLRIAVADTTRPGQTITVYDAAYATLDVEAVEALSMVLTEPVQQSSGDEVVVSLTNRSFQSDFRWEVLHSELPLWFPMRRPHWQPDAVDVAVQVVNEGGDSVDLESTIQQNTSVQPSDFITLSVRNSVDTNNPTSVTLSPEGFDGDTWRGQINGLESGEYEFEFNAMQDPIGNTNRAFLPTASTIGYRVDVSGNPWVSAAEWGIGWVAGSRVGRCDFWGGLHRDKPYSTSVGSQ